MVSINCKYVLYVHDLKLCSVINTIEDYLELQQDLGVSGVSMLSLSNKIHTIRYNYSMPISTVNELKPASGVVKPSFMHQLNFMMI